MKYLIPLVFLIVACSPIKRFTRLVEKYPYLLTVDSVIIHDTISIYIPKVEVDTVVTIEQLIDTVIVTKDRVTVKTWYVPKDKKVYVQGKCDPIYITKVVEKKIPVKYYDKTPWWKKLLNNTLAIFIIFAIVYFAYKLYRKLI
jgi:hypothetical protein